MAAANKVVLTGYDLIKGATTNNIGMNFMNMSPFQMIPMDDKDESWIKWNADFYEGVGYSQVTKGARKQVKNRWLAAGILDHQDYLLSPEYNNFSDIVGIMKGKDDDFQSPLQQFYSIIPNVIDVLRGEHLKRDSEVIIKGVDEFSISEALAYKENMLQQILEQKQVQDKQAALARMGIVDGSGDPKMQDQYAQQIQQARQVAAIQSKFKTFRSIAEQFAQHTLNVDREAKHLDELDNEAFTETLVNARELWHLDMGDDDYKLELIDNAYAFSHQSDTIKYVGDGDYTGWFKWMTVGDIINSLGKKLTDVQLEGLKTIVSSNMGAMIVPDMWKNFPGMYYDTTKKWPEGGRVDPSINDSILERNLKGAFAHTNTTNYSAAELMRQNTNSYGDPHMFRVMFLYWRSQRKVGFLTKKDRSGEIVYADWVDENFKVTVDPEYDNSLVKSKTKNNLIYGEHVDWTYVNDWRKVIKINSNLSHSFWTTNNIGFTPIYLDGKSVKFQFKGDDNPYESRPPVEGRIYKYWGVRPVSITDRLKPWQIVHNIANNKIPKLISEDLGIAVAIQKGMYGRNTGGLQSTDPKGAFLDTIRDYKILEYEVSRETLELPNQAAIPTRVDLSVMDEVLKYANLAEYAKRMALETVGITMQRLGETKASETLGGNQTAIEYSETQTEPIFNQHSNETMLRIVGRMIEAAQFFCSTKEASRVYYMNSQEENEWMEIEGTKSLARHYHIYPTNKPKVKKMLNELKTLIMNDNTMGASLMEKVQGIVGNSIPEYIRLLNESEQKRIDREDQQFQAEQGQGQQKLAAEKELQDADFVFKAAEGDKQRASNEKIAEIRALGGIQTDNNANGMLDATENLKAFQLQDQFDRTHGLEQDKLSQETANQQQNRQLEREKLLSKEKVEALKAKTALKNKTSGEK